MSYFKYNSATGWSFSSKVHCIVYTPSFPSYQGPLIYIFGSCNVISPTFPLISKSNLRCVMSGTQSDGKLDIAELQNPITADECGLADITVNPSCLNDAAVPAEVN